MIFPIQRKIQKFWDFRKKKNGTTTPLHLLAARKGPAKGEVKTITDFRKSCVQAV